MNVSRFMGVVGLSVLALGCGNDDDGTDPTPILKIEIVSGNNQLQQTGLALTNNLTAKVTDASNQPVSGTTVNWTVTGGGGALSAPSSVTNAEGIASIGFTVGPAEGTNTITATIASQPTASVAFTALVRWETFVANMNGANESPPLTNSAVGTSTFKLVSSTTMNFEVAVTGLTGTFSGLHIHAPLIPPATTAGVIVNLCPAAANCAISATGTFNHTGTITGANFSSATWGTTLTEQQKFDSLLVMMRKGDVSYTNIHTSVNGGGQARGPIAPKPLTGGAIKAGE